MSRAVTTAEHAKGWERFRGVRGALWFIAFFGVVKWGLPMALYLSVGFWLLGIGEFFEVFRTAIVYTPLFGVVFGTGMWVCCEFVSRQAPNQSAKGPGHAN
jgi:hypothetical protein